MKVATLALHLVAIFSTAEVRVNTAKSVLERAQRLWFMERCLGGYHFEQHQQKATNLTCMGSMLQNAMNRGGNTDLHKTAYRYRPAQDSLPLQTCIRQLTVTDLKAVHQQQYNTQTYNIITDDLRL